MKFVAVLLFCLLLNPAVGREACPGQIRVTFPDFSVPPFINGTGLNFSDPPGRLVDWVRQAIAKTGCAATPVFNRRPRKRGLVEMAQSQADLLLPVTSTAGRDGTLVFPTVNGRIDQRMALAGLKISLWVRSGERQVAWTGKQLVGPPGFRVGVAAGSVAHDMAALHGWDVELAVNSQKSIEKLVAGRVPVVLVADVVVQGAPENTRMLMEKLSPGLGVTYFYSAASVPFHDRYPEFMSKYWKALGEVAHAARH